MDQPRNLPGFPTVMMPIRNKSMWPSLKDGQLVWITFMRADYAYEREQIVVFQAPMDDEGHRDADPLYWIKRVIAVAGDIVAIHNNQVSVNGVAVEEPYVADAGSVDVEPTRVPHGRMSGCKATTVPLVSTAASSAVCRCGESWDWCGRTARMIGRCRREPPGGTLET